MVDLLKFTSNKILNRVVILNYNQVCCQTLSSFIYLLLGNHQKNEGNQIWYQGWCNLFELGTRL